MGTTIGDGNLPMLAYYRGISVEIRQQAIDDLSYFIT